jgi:predicted TIM-barrel fold metal-dependent hydrolase
VAVVSRHTSPDEISRLDAAGVVGARLNLVVDHLGDPELARARLAQNENHIPVHWHVQLHVDLGVLNALADHIERSSRTYVLDHMGLARSGQGVVAAPWQGLLRLARGGKLYVKLSAPYLVSDTGPPHDDLRPLAESLLAARADRVLWGSNWPHTQGTGRKSDADIDAVEPFREVDDQAWLDRCSAWSGAQVRALLSDNAAKLYGFDGTHAAVRPVPAAG